MTPLRRTCVPMLTALVASLALCAPGLAAERGPNSVPDVQPQVVGGWDAGSDGHGWLASLQQKGEGTDSERHVCVGSLIAPKWILTAAHCVVSSGMDQPEDWSVVLGETNLDDDVGTRFSVDELVVHSGYDKSAHTNDIALFKLAAPAKGFPFLPLAQSPDSSLWGVGVTQNIMGWGATEESGAGSAALQWATIPILEPSSCAEENTSHVYAGFTDATMLCAGVQAGGVDTCQGDSGGPLVSYHGSQPVQTGIVSYGDGCARVDRPGVYTKVAAYFGWIRARMGGRKLDLMFAIDSTGSMWDDIDAARDVSVGLTAIYGLLFDLRVGLVDFKDDGDAYQANLDLDLTDDLSGFRDSIDALEASGGGDWPESVYSGLMMAFDRSWRADARRVVLLFGDAPPHDPEPVTAWTRDDVVRAAREAFVPEVTGTARAAGVRALEDEPLNAESVSIFGLTVGGDLETQTSFEDLSTSTGGRALNAANATEAVEKLGSTLVEELLAEPIADAGGPYAGIAGQPVALEGSGTDEDGTISSYEWDFDDDGTTDATSANASHTFTDPGEYTVTLTVTDDDGLKGRASALVTVVEAPVVPPAPVLPAPVKVTPTKVPVQPPVQAAETNTAPFSVPSSLVPPLAKPSNKFTTRRRASFARGRARILVDLPGSGVLGVAPVSAARASASRRRVKRVFTTRQVKVLAAGRLVVPLKLSRSARRRLARRGKLSFRARLTFVPAGGSARSSTRRFVVRVPRA